MDNLTLRFQAAVQQFWTGRDDALQRQIEAGKVDAGTRGSVTSGGHMGAIEALVVELLVDAGLDREHVQIKVKDPRPQTRLQLPGYYRAEKQWDLLVISGEQLIAAIEFKSMSGSFGNNLNNRAEEAIGNAEDIWKSFREERLGRLKPFLGYFFLLEDCPAVHSPVSVKEPYFEVDPIFKGASYSQRSAILCQRLILERLYDATCLTLATKEVPTKVSHPIESTNFERFASQLQGHARGLTDNH